MNAADDDTSHLTRDSLLGRLGLSVRGIAVIVMIATVCACAITTKKVEEPLYSLAIAAVSYYFGQQRTHTKP